MEITKQQKDILLGLLDKFVEVCEQNGLRYYLAGGSVLGAVRHKGFIPWDDDIDVNMPREDYEKLQKLPATIWGDNMRLASWRTVKNYRYDFLKVEFLKTTLIERIYPNYVGAAFLDIFPIDYVPEDEKERQDQLSKLQRYAQIQVNAYLRHDNECESLYQLLSLKISRLLHKKPKIYDQWENIASQCMNSNLVTDLHSFIMARPFPISYYGDGVKLEFEGKKYIVPQEWDKYLTHLYGNYMELPPVNKRIGHSFDFVDYNHRLSNDELKEVFQRLHKKYAYNFSLKHELKVFLRKIRLLK